MIPMHYRSQLLHHVQRLLRVPEPPSRQPLWVLPGTFTFTAERETRVYVGSSFDVGIGEPVTLLADDSVSITWDGTTPVVLAIVPDATTDGGNS
jgi:hypothetical protein